MDIIRNKLDKWYAQCEFAVSVHKKGNHDITDAEKSVIFYQGLCAGGVMMLSHLLPSDLFDEYLAYSDELSEKMMIFLEKTYRKGE